jgi:dihydroxyacetone kinase-like predicted kinase
MLDYGSDDPEAIAALMTESMQGSVTGSVARAVRDAKVGDVKVSKDDYLALIDHTMVAASPSKTQALSLLAEKLQMQEREFAILIYGKSVTDEEKASAQSAFMEKYPRVELYEIDGGQDVYDFLLLVE